MKRATMLFFLIFGFTGLPGARANVLNDLAPSMQAGTWAQISGTASDNVGVVGVPFKRDGTNFGAEDTARPYTVSWNTAQTTDGFHTLRTVARDAAGNTTPSAGVTVTASNNTTTLLLTGSDYDTRCSAPGVVRCYGFDDLNDLTTGHPRNLTNPTDSTSSRMYDPSGGTSQCTGGKCWALDTGIKASGNSALRFEVPDGTGADTSGSFRMNFTDDFSVQFGAGEEFYVQYRERFSPEMLRAFSGANGWKQQIIGLGDRVNSPIAYSCTSEEMVIQQDTHFLGPGFYHSCGNWETMEYFDGTQVRLQHQSPPPCYYPNDPQGGCFKHVANEWMTFKVNIKIGGWGTHPGNRIRVWAARENQPSVMIFDSINSHPNGFTIYRTDANAKYGKIWLLPYNTNKSASAVHPTAYVWYDELIISRNDIADPTGSTPPPPSGDTTAPMVSITDPANNATVSGTITVSGTASDDVGVAGVQFKLDGANLGSEDTSSSYSVSWNTTQATNGSHTLTALARDAAGNQATSAPVTVTVSNGVTPPAAPTGLRIR